MDPTHLQRNGPIIDDDEDEDIVNKCPGGTWYNDIYIPPPAPLPVSEYKKGPRLVISHIENENFKSYAGRQVLGPFHKCFNAIIGPNGSGKSNVIDSLLFVFGYRAAKIRSKKLSVLLHSSDLGTVEKCMVAVHFIQIVDKEEKFETIPDSNIKIARTAFKDNSSFYTINDRRVKFKDVALLLREHGIDIDHNRFLILQGEVEQIAMMKPKGASEHDTGMLEFIEDIVGTSRYKEPIEKMYGVVDTLTEERTEKINRVKLVESEKNALEEPVAEVIAYLEAENEITKKTNVLLQKTIYDHEIIEADYKKSVLEVQERGKGIFQKLKEIEQEEIRITKEIEKLSKEQKQLKQENEKLKEKFNVANTKDAGLQEQMVQLSRDRKELKEVIAKERRKVTAYESSSPTKKEKEVEELQKHEEKMVAEREKLNGEREKIMAALQVDTQDLQERKDELEHELVPVQKEVAATKQAYDVAQSSLDLYLSTEQKEATKLDQIQTNLDKATAGLQDREEELEKLKTQVPEFECKLCNAQTDLKQVLTEEAMKANRLRELWTAIEENRIAKQNSRAQNKVVEFLLDLKDKGLVPGVLGRLGDLGAVDPKYDVAVSTACGALDHVVVETVESAQKCINALKEKSVGRGTFIALEKQEYLRSQAEGRISTPESAPRLVDLIKMKDRRLKTAFYFALRDTLVADNLSQATRIAYGARRFRVVTLDGQVIETSGTMSGGGQRVSKGRIGTQIHAMLSADEQEKIDQEYNELQVKAAELRERQTALEATVNQLSGTLPSLRMRLNKDSIEVQSLREQVPTLMDQLARQQIKVKEAKPKKTETQQLTHVRDAAHGVYCEIDAKGKKLLHERRKIQTKIEEITRNHVGTTQNKIDEFTRKIDQVRKELAKINMNEKSAKRNYKISVEKIATMEVELEEYSAKLKKMEEEKQKIEEDGTKWVQEMEEIGDQLLERESKSFDLKNELSGVFGEKTNAKTDKLELQKEIDALNKVVNENSMIVRVNKRKLTDLKVRDIPGRALPLLPKLTEEELKVVNVLELQWEVTLKENNIAGKTPDMAILESYKQKTENFIKRTQELEEVTIRRSNARKVLEEVRQRRLAEFLDGYNLITYKLKEMYQMITLGGDAELELVDSLDPFSEGIVFSVRPPKKSWKNISNLSGGEKTLSSLALVFALHHYKPSPLFIMDEIDAALDFKNVSIVGHYIKDRTRNAQFIIISLRSNMFELADHLIGIFKTFDCTKPVCISPSDYTKLWMKKQSLNNGFAGHPVRYLRM